MERPVEDPDTNDANQWSIAGIRDCWLDGSHHTDLDRKIADLVLVGAPYLPYMVRAYRALLRRLSGYMVEAGVRQFLDLGSDFPTAGNVHQVVQAINPECRVVYVEIDPAVVAQSKTLLAGNDHAVMLCGDFSQPAQVLDATQRSGLLDLELPVAVLMTDILHNIPDADDPAGLISVYVDAVCPGSYVSIAHTCDDKDIVDGLKIFGDCYQVPIPSLAFRDPMQLTTFFEGLDLIDPGIVPVPLWRPDQNDDLGVDPASFPAFCGLGRKL